MPDATTALISAGVSAVVSATVSYFTRRSSERTAIEGKLLKSIELAMSYSHVEDAEYCAEWLHPPKKPPADAPAGEQERYEAAHEKWLQYDMYCCFVFNMLESAWRYCWWKKNVGDIVDPDEIIETHRCWWESQKRNLVGYPPKFRQYVQSILDAINARKAGLK